MHSENGLMFFKPGRRICQRCAPKFFQPASLPPEGDDVRNIYHGKKDAYRNVFRVAGANLVVYTVCQ